MLKSSFAIFEPANWSRFMVLTKNRPTDRYLIRDPKNNTYIWFMKNS